MVVKVAGLLHRVLLASYPSGFRRRFAADMQRMFEARLAVARARSRRAAARFALLEYLDVVWGGVLERFAGDCTADRWVIDQEGASMNLETTLADVRFGLRLMRRSPLFTALAMGALALGIGATGAIFAAVNAVLLQPLPYSRPDGLVMIWSNNTNESHPRNPVSPADYLDLKLMNQSFSAIEAMQSFFTPEQLTDGSQPVPVQSAYVTGGMFELLGRPPLAGRYLRPNDQHVVLLSYGFWKSRYGGDRSVIGRTVDINGAPAEIVGVMPQDFSFPFRTMLGPSGFARAQNADVWEPIQFQGRFYLNADGSVARQGRFLGLVGRLKDGRTVNDGRLDVTTVAASLAKSYPTSNAGWDTTVVPLHEQAVGVIRPALWLLFAGVGVLWLIACANVANLLLARSMARRNEVALRRALGASRWRLARQSIVEGLLLALGGGVGGVILLYVGIPALVALAPSDTPRIASIAPNLSVFAFMFVLAAATGILTSVLPASAATRSDLHGVLKDSGRGATTSLARTRLRAWLVVGEIALAVLLTSGATLLVRSFVSLMGVDPGFSVDRLLTFQINAPQTPNQQALLDYYNRVFTALDAIPGVVASGGTTRVPLGSTNVSTLVTIDGRDIPPAQLPEVELRRAQNAYFDAMGIPVLRGRGFTFEDAGLSAQPVCVINRAMQLRLFPSEDPIGRRVRMGTNPRASWITIVGVIGDVRHGSLEETPKSELYISGNQNPPNSPYIAIRASGDPGALTDAVRRAVWSVDSHTPIYDLKTMTAMRSESVAERRFVLTLASVFGVLALLLAASGVYGVMTLIVSERTPEVGVRVALGATRADILTLIVGHSAKLGLIGIAIGVAASAVFAPLMASQLFGVRPFDLVTFAIVPLVLMSAAVLAAAMPARRAMQVDPVVALRND